MPTKRKIAFWLTRAGKGTRYACYVVKWDGPEPPVHKRRRGTSARDWRRESGGVNANYERADHAAAYYGVSVLPGPGQAIPYYITAGRPVNAK